MARPLKDGVDYWPFDVGLFRDKKIRLIRSEFGCKGAYIALELINAAYETNGYFKKWDDDDCYLMSDGVGGDCSPQLISEVVQGCVRRSLFDKRVFDMFGVLTSAGIQRRYMRIVGNSRDEIEIIREYWLLNVNNKKDVPASVLNKLTFISVSSIENPDNITGNINKTTDNRQSKVKESKVKKSKVNDNDMGGAASAPSPRRHFISIILNDGSEYPVYEDQISKWEQLYPAVNVKQELRKMAGWCEANPNRRKTKRGILSFINSWLSREQDRGGTRNGSNCTKRTGSSAEAKGRTPLGTVV